jgi:hypothetical protein
MFKLKRKTSDSSGGRDAKPVAPDPKPEPQLEAATPAAPQKPPAQAQHRPALPGAPRNPQPQLQRRPAMPSVPRVAPRTRASPKGR